jgi:DNA repair protein RadA/Sms
MVIFGEIGLSGEVRSVGQTDARLKEAAKLGFARALIPAGRGRKAAETAGLQVDEIGHLRDMVGRIAGTRD